MGSHADHFETESETSILKLIEEEEDVEMFNRGYIPNTKDDFSASLHDRKVVSDFLKTCDKIERENELSKSVELLKKKLLERKKSSLSYILGDKLQLKKGCN